MEGDPYEIALVTSNGGKILATIDAAALSPERGASFFGSSSASWIRLLLGVTIGLLGFLAIEATLEGMELGPG
ncbi:MAG TPA: hypothetical protein VIM08_19195 [Arthrobacter sp.]